jgi:hypothetical protein
VANAEHLKLLREGVSLWNAWRKKEPPVVPDLSDASLVRKELVRANFSRAYLNRANLSEANLNAANLGGADLTDANIYGASLVGTELGGANLRGACLAEARLFGAQLRDADLSGAILSWANLLDAKLNGANLTGAILQGANLTRANLNGANLAKAILHGSVLLEADLQDADLTGCRVYGISAWNVKTSVNTKQQNLVINHEGEPEIAVDNIEVAQFVYLLLDNAKIRDVIDTVGRKGVLLLGRFTERRIAVLDRLGEELRKRGYIPIVFNFDKPNTKDFTETVRLLAGFSRFVIADVTNPKSAPLELQATVPEIMVPFRPIIEEGEKPFAMLQDLWIKHRDWVFEPISSVDALVGSLDKEIIEPAEVRFKELVLRKAERMTGKHV